MRAYVVSTGSYSDYSVAAVFADKALAEAHARDIGGNDVEEYDFLTEAPTRFTVYSKSNDTYQGPEPREWTYMAWSYNRGLYKRAEVTEWAGRFGPSLRVVGWSQAAVRKAFDDRYALIQAKTAGVA